ncbi:MAG TPA: DUF3854 domain-containing protein [Coleofasciculaceae cyanobacterium]
MNNSNFLTEFRASAVSDRLALANVSWIEGDEAVECLTEHAINQIQNNTSYFTEPAKKIIARYEFAKAGGWMTYGTTLTGDLGSVAYFKPHKPRMDFERQKRIKYETAAKAEALPLLPFVDSETATEIYHRYNVTPLAGETFWQVVHRCSLPLAICEGLKKALSLLTHGIPAIAIRSITQWHQKGTNALYPALVDFATPKRQIFVVFDQDEKPSTQRNVRTQALKFAAALEQQGCQVKIPLWDRQLGKGIDDVLCGQGDNAQSWLKEAFKQASTVAGLRQSDRLAKALEVLNQLNALSYPIERATEGEYLPKLPPFIPRQIHAIDATLNSGKTLRIGTDWVKAAIARGWNVLVLAPSNGLGEQTAADWDLPHIHKYGTSAEQQQVLWTDVNQSHGIVMCPDSLHRLPQWFSDRPVLLVLDEANQVIEHMAQGNTLKSRWADILERFTLIARRAIETGAIVLSEHGLPDRAVDFVKQISGAKAVRVFTHHKQGDPWNCILHRGQASDFRAKFLEEAKLGRRLLYVTSSQAEAKRMERALAKADPNLKVVRIDSQTNQAGEFSLFFENPGAWLEAEQPDILILSPSAKSGISIQGGVKVEDAYFAKVWGYFPALATDTHLQLLGRFRPTVDRIIFCPDFLFRTGDESLLYPRAIGRRLHMNAKALASVYGITELFTAPEDQAEQLMTIESAVMDYLKASIAVSGAQKMMAHQSLHQQLEAAGHLVTCETLTKNDAAIALWKEIQETIWREDAAAIADAEVEAEHTADWARATLGSFEVSLKVRNLAYKVLWREEFPGVTFDDAEECYQALCKDYGAMRRGVMLQAKAENLEAAKEVERAAVEAILKGDLPALHRLPRELAKAILIARIGVLALLDDSIYHNQDPRAIAVKKEALHFAKEISYWLRLTVNESQTPVHIVNKLLKKLGLNSIAVARPGAKGQQTSRHWRVDGLSDPIRCRLLEALRSRFEVISPIGNKELSNIQIEDASQPRQGGEGSFETVEGVDEGLEGEDCSVLEAESLPLSWARKDEADGLAQEDTDHPPSPALRVG